MLVARIVQQHEHDRVGPAFHAPRAHGRAAVPVGGRVAALVAGTPAGHDRMIQPDVGQTEEQQLTQQVAVNARHARTFFSIASTSVSDKRTNKQTKKKTLKELKNYNDSNIIIVTFF